MCGIYFRLHRDAAANFNYDEFSHLRARGPDSTNLHIEQNAIIGFHRLAINDVSDLGNQPMIQGNIYLICNGEIYNHADLRDLLNPLSFQSYSDCEVIIQGFIEWGPRIFSMLEGEFAAIIWDKKNKLLYVARDTHAVRPLYFYTSSEEIILTSELKANNTRAVQFPPNTLMTLSYSFESPDPLFNIKMDKLHPPIPRSISSSDEEPNEYHSIAKTLAFAVRRRIINSERPLACLLSGGLDSSLVSAIASRELILLGLPPQSLKTFSIGLEGSPDLFFAEKVAAHIKSTHTTIKLTETDFLDAINETIRTIESYDITTVRASVGNFLVARYIAAHTDCKVVLCGDYSDEVCGGYRYFRQAPSPEEFDSECRRLVGDIHYFDGLRADRSISGNGLEARFPFSDPEFVSAYWAIPTVERMLTPRTGIEKFPLRRAFANTGLLPAEVLWRPKEAFSDGVSAETRSWYEIIEEHIGKIIPDDEFIANKDKFTHNPPPTKEAYYYRIIFEEFYPQNESIPYFWLPRWTTAGSGTLDPSARRGRAAPSELSFAERVAP